ncbi:hypothetical protein AB1Y20_013986 [Prymnesium parvum]|uniref:Uncharacterized protein n=1 Tax=Prymnesium parvum TaxID=97485 RepID=A0AB34IH12_PRYPA
MAEGSGGEAAVVSFDDLTRAANAAAQLVRAHLSPPGAAKTWLGPSALLAEALAGSVLRCKSADAGSFTVVVPPRAPSPPLVKRQRNVVFVRVTRDGLVASAHYEEFLSLQVSVLSITPGILTMEGGRGPLADAVRRLETGEAVTVSVTGSPPPAIGAMFTILDSQGRTICASTDFQKILDEIAVQEVPVLP